ncbi:putative transmembrane protein [Toxoplasma gondii TgCatPRC2]|uniref:Transmembrane protein n=5 Tax=Toxoplasma gondii TaxID=5811 RepID=S8F294_TOXGM|nr:hypothetical protein TGME49_266810 [Toxoplasma gondii ME49]KFG58870.1 putative transmembrane protein [Toxoplasma gondii RUB]KYF45543.1 hypothetical protein TGARI_266810 [Toxoplasma gondii ARI]KYK64957.1 putative transmembrane protein [Toxoplasma gondii TgCatPRC2]PIM02049.1 putative transmembrane protein [Toxoplasma gondii COUG]EPT27633.1 hypothetical protein TGME49_266810 [Toxoplasma gondii ME49]|eukprot:XP_002368760.1 hypothetical protein TGME49_266810 [Toxoplasma gondii ME49]
MNAQSETSWRSTITLAHALFLEAFIHVSRMAARLGVCSRGSASKCASREATASFSGRSLLRHGEYVLVCRRVTFLFLLYALCLNVPGVFAEYPRGGRSRGSGSSYANQHQRVTRATPLFGFSRSPSPESLVTALLLFAGFAALFLLLVRRGSSRTSSAAATGVIGGNATEGKDDDSVFRPCASICLNEILLKKSADGDKFVTVDAAIDPFLSLCSWSKLFVFVQVNTDEEEQQVLDELEKLQAFERGLQRHRVMFSSTRNGRASMVRQLQPLTHIDADDFIAVTLEGKVPNVVYLQEPLKECVAVLQAALQSPTAA